MLKIWNKNLFNQATEEDIRTDMESVLHFECELLTN